MTAQKQSSFWSRNAREVGNFVSKPDLADSGEAFTIKRVRHGRGNFGPQWYLDIVLDSDSDGTKSVLTFPATENRTEMMTDLKDTVANGETVRAILVSFINKAGQTGYDLAPEVDVTDNEDVRHMLLRQQRQELAPEVDVTDSEDVPF